MLPVQCSRDPAPTELGRLPLIFVNAQLELHQVSIILAPAD